RPARAQLPSTLLLLQFPWMDNFNASDRIPVLLHAMGYGCAMPPLLMRMVALVRPSEMPNCLALCGAQCDCAPSEHRAYGHRNIAQFARGEHDYSLPMPTCGSTYAHGPR
ncbi:MAG: hypothetical protein SGPRY_014855, partial [Prymnesium sp.]